MRNIVSLVILVGLAWYGYTKYQAANDHSALEAVSSPGSELASGAGPTETSHFTCAGRTHCSQMKSCAEATYFIQHCPDTRMDGDNDGVPCERQWCE